MVLSQELETMSNSIFNNNVPELWAGKVGLYIYCMRADPLKMKAPGVFGDTDRIKTRFRLWIWQQTNTQKQNNEQFQG